MVSFINGLITIALYVVFVIGAWKVFVKLGEPGWKAIIPVYNLYIVFKHCWNAKMFWIYLIIGIISGVCQFAYKGEASSIFLGIITIAAGIAYIVIQLKLCHYTAVSFQHGWGYAFGLFFLPFIFVLILGFGGSKYIGNMSPGASGTAYSEPPLSDQGYTYQAPTAKPAEEQAPEEQAPEDKA